MSKKIILREDQFEKLKMFFAKQGNQYSYSPEKVLIVKAYLDDNFSHDPEDNIEGIGADGYVSNTPIVFMKNTFTGKKINSLFQGSFFFWRKVRDSVVRSLRSPTYCLSIALRTSRLKTVHRTIFFTSSALLGFESLLLST